MNSSKQRIVSVCLAALVLLMSGCATQGGGKFDPVTSDIPKIDPLYPPTNVELSFNSGGAQLPAYLMIANGRGPHPTVLLLHGFPGNEKNLDIAQALRRAGFNVMFFNYRGAWGAQGEFRIANLSRDAANAVQFLRSRASEYRIDQLQLSLLGHSMGGFAALRTVARDSRLDCVVGLAAANVGAIASRSDKEQADFAAYADGLFMLNGYSGRTALRELRQNAREFDLLNDVGGMGGKSVLLITGTEDTAVPVTVQRQLAEAYAADPRINLTAIEIPGDHAFSGQRIALQRLVMQWLVRNCAWSMRG